MPDILVIDDDSDFVRLVVPLIELRGYDVRVARTGAMATVMCAERTPDGVLLDGLLPDTNGMVWLTQFRMTHPQTPVWFVSAFRFAQEAKAHARLTRDLGAKVLSKPIDVPALAAQMVTAIPVDDLQLLDDAELVGDLEAEFAAGLPEKLAHLREAVCAFAAQPSEASYQAALVQAHKLHGSAGMYGLDELGERAGELERMLREGQPGAGEGRVNQALIATTDAMIASRYAA